MISSPVPFLRGVFLLLSNRSEITSRFQEGDAGLMNQRFVKNLM